MSGWDTLACDKWADIIENGEMVTCTVAYAHKLMDGAALAGLNGIALSNFTTAFLGMLGLAIALLGFAVLTGRIDQSEFGITRIMKYVIVWVIISVMALRFNDYYTPINNFVSGAPADITSWYMPQVEAAWGGLEGVQNERCVQHEGEWIISLFGPTYVPAHETCSREVFTIDAGLAPEIKAVKGVDIILNNIVRVGLLVASGEFKTGQGSTAYLGITDEQPIDTEECKKFKRAGTSLLKMGIDSLVNLIVGLVIMIVGVLYVAIVMFIMIMVKIRTTVLMLLGPVFISLGLFPKTRDMTQKWIQSLIAVILTIILLLTVIAVVNLMLMTLLADLSLDCQLRDGYFREVMVCVILVVATIFTKQLPGLAQDLTGAQGGAEQVANTAIQLTTMTGVAALGASKFAAGKAWDGIGLAANKIAKGVGTPPGTR